MDPEPQHFNGHFDFVSPKIEARDKVFVFDYPIEFARAVSRKIVIFAS
jgi:hypothetical protein